MNELNMKLFIIILYILKKTLKYLVRQGIPNHLRSEIWHIFIRKQVSNIRKEKDPCYFQNLCHLLPNSDVRT